MYRRDAFPVSYLVGFGLSAALLIGWLIITAVRYEADATAEVVDVQWERKIDVLTWAQTRDQGWHLPPGAYNVQREWRVSGSHRVPSGSHRVCSGTGKNRSCYSQTDYRTVWDYSWWYRYWLDRWIVTATPTQAAHNQHPHWPDVSELNTCTQAAYGCQKAGTQYSRYQVLFRVNSTDYPLDLIESEWMHYPVGGRAHLTLNIFNQIRRVEPAPSGW